MEKISLKERLAATEAQGAAGYPLVGETIGCVFQGAFLGSGKKYLSWLLKQITELYSTTPSYPYETMVYHADHLIQMEAYHEEGYELMYQVAIEPFYLMDQNNKNNRGGK